MSHPFGDLLTQYLHRKHGLSQAKLAEGILQDPSVIGKMCKGQRLNGPQARERVCAIIDWLRTQAVLSSADEANQLLIAAGMAPLRANNGGEQAILKHFSVQPTAPVRMAPGAPRRTNLPAPLTSFIGRAQELAEVGALVAQKRLVTLTGVGGVGKTRLAIEVAKALLHFSLDRAAITELGNRKVKSANPQFPDGIWLVELAAVTPPNDDATLGTVLVTQAIARVIKRPEQAGALTLAAMQEDLADKALLLVLDNCEHLAAACAEISERLLHHCWGLHILATSREELRIAGETLYPVLPLALPSATEHTPEQVLASAAAQLLVDRMRTVQPTLQIQEPELITLAHICRQLDGIPLALELAAPLTRSLSLTEIAAQLDDQMALLTNGYRTAIPRHQTMHSALVWSYRLLSAEQQRLLARLAVFAGGWTLAAAQATCTDETLTPAMIVLLLNQLIAQSLVLVEGQQGERRYRLLEPVRQFAYMQLSASSELKLCQRRYADYFMRLAEQLEEARDTPQEQEWLQRLEPERNNLRGVNRWAFAQNEVEFAHRFNGLLFAFWGYRSSLSEARYWLESALALGERASGRKRTSAALMAEAAALNLAGHAAALTNEFDQAEALFERERRLRTECGDSKGIANALRGISFALMLSNKNLPQARQYIEQALALCHAVDDEWGIAWSHFDLGYLAMVCDERTEAQAHLTAALPMFRDQGNHFGLFHALVVLGHLMQNMDNKEEARRFYKDALRLHQRLCYVLHTADCLEGLAAIAVIEQKPVRAVHLFGAAHAHRQANALTRPYHQDATYAQAVTRSRAQLAPDAWRSAWTEGTAMPLEQAVEYAVAG